MKTDSIDDEKLNPNGTPSGINDAQTKIEEQY